MQPVKITSPKIRFVYIFLCVRYQNPVSEVIALSIYFFVPPHQTTRWGSEANLGSRRIVKTSRPLGGTILRRWRNTSHRRTTRKALEENMGWGCKTKAPWGGNTTRKSTSMSPKKVLSPRCFFCNFVTSCLSLSDYKSGFGGKFGVAEQKDKSALGWEHHEKVEKHESQKGELCTSAASIFIRLHYIFFSTYIFVFFVASCACHYFCILKTTRRDSGANLGCRRIG